jgi:putative SOS response-associated peptidase YedK
MCGRFTMRADPALLAERFGVEAPAQLRPRDNVAPTEEVVIVTPPRQGEDGARVLRPARWGLVPHWAPDLRGGARTINARAETLLERPSWHPLLERRRCLIPADGFYEWRADPDGVRRPLLFTLPDGEPFGFAGLWASWRDDARGQWVDTCTIVTTTANEVVAHAHDRMPVILPRAAEQPWLDREVAPEEAVTLLRPYGGAMTVTEVAPLPPPGRDMPEQDALF